MKKKTIAGLVVSAALLTCPVLPSSGYAASTNFTDIDNSFAKDAILSLQQEGIISGLGDGTYNPTGYLTRVQFAKILVLSNGLDVSTQPKVATFNDVPTTSWAFPYVEAAVKAGFITGYTDGTFKGGANLSREHMAVMFVRSLGVDVSGYSSKLSFNDSGIISSPYKDAVAYSVKAGLISGKTDGRFDPKGYATREQVAKVAATFINVKDDIKKPIPTPEPTPKPEIPPVANPVPNPIPVPDPIPNPDSIPNPQPGLSAQELAVAKIEGVVQNTGNADDIDILTLNTALNNETALSENLEVYRKKIVEVEEYALNSTEKIQGMVEEINSMFTLISKGVTAIFDDNLSYVIDIDQNNIHPEIVKNKWTSAIFSYHVEGTRASIYEDMKVISTLSSDSPLLYSKSSIGLTEFKGESANSSDDIVIIFLDDDKKVIGYAPLTEEDVRLPSSNAKILLKEGQTVISNVLKEDEMFYVISVSPNTTVNDLLGSITAEDMSHQKYELFNISDPYEDGDSIILSDSLLTSYSETNNPCFYFINLIPQKNEAWTVPSFQAGIDNILDLSDLFTDEDVSDTLSYSIEALDKDIANVTNGEMTTSPTIHPSAEGTARFKVTVDDGNGGTNETIIPITITTPFAINAVLESYSNGLNLSISIPNGMTNVQVHYKAVSDPYWSSIKPVNILNTENPKGANSVLEPGDTTVMFDGLSNGNTYNVKIVGIINGKVYSTDIINANTM